MPLILDWRYSSFRAPVDRCRRRPCRVGEQAAWGLAGGGRVVRRQLAEEPGVGEARTELLVREVGVLVDSTSVGVLALVGLRVVPEDPIKILFERFASARFLVVAGVALAERGLVIGWFGSRFDYKRRNAHIWERRLTLNVAQSTTAAQRTEGGTRAGRTGLDPGAADGCPAVGGQLQHG